jgi:hypothetical protein
MPALFGYAPPRFWVFGCAAFALMYFLVWPRGKADGRRSGLRYFALRWFHGLVWVLLGGAVALYGWVDDEGGTARWAAKALAGVAFVVYLGFLFAAYGPRGTSAPSRQ